MKFIYNNTQNIFIKVFSFYVNYKYHLKSLSRLIIMMKVINLSAKKLIIKLQNIHIQLQSQLEIIQVIYKKKYNYYIKKYFSFIIRNKI